MILVRSMLPFDYTFDPCPSLRIILKPFPLLHPATPIFGNPGSLCCCWQPRAYNNVYVKNQEVAPYSLTGCILPLPEMITSRIPVLPCLLGFIFSDFGSSYPLSKATAEDQPSTLQYEPTRREPTPTSKFEWYTPTSDWYTPTSDWYTPTSDWYTPTSTSWRPHTTLTPAMNASKTHRSHHPPTPTSRTETTDITTSSTRHGQTTISKIASSHHTSSSSAPSKSSSESLATVSPSNSKAFDPMARDNVVVYYGQSDETSNVPLRSICADPSVDIVILAFLTTLLGPGGWPTLNIESNCGPSTKAQLQAGASGLIDCVSDGFAHQISQCQAAGKKVLLSMGGANGDIEIPDPGTAHEMAHTLWDVFLGGDNATTTGIRPFGRVVLDGIDIGTYCPYFLPTGILLVLF